MAMKPIAKWSLIAVGAMFALSVILNLAGYEPAEKAENTQKEEQRQNDDLGGTSTQSEQTGDQDDGYVGLDKSLDEIAFDGIDFVLDDEGNYVYTPGAGSGFAVKAWGRRSAPSKILIAFSAQQQAEDKLKITGALLINIFGNDGATKILKQIGVMAQRKRSDVTTYTIGNKTAQIGVDASTGLISVYALPVAE